MSAHTKSIFHTQTSNPVALADIGHSLECMTVTNDIENALSALKEAGRLVGRAVTLAGAAAGPSAGLPLTTPRPHHKPRKGFFGYPVSGFSG